MKPTSEDLLEIKSLWKLKGEPSFVRKVENWIYKSDKDDAFIRITEPSHRSKEMLQAELDWMHYLHSKGIALAKPIASEKGNLVEAVSPHFFVSLFQKAEGVSLNQIEDFTPTRLKNWGMLLGRLHEVTQSYVPSKSIRLRPEWNEERNYLVVEKLNHPKFEEFSEWMNRLPKDKTHYGLIHADLHYGNFFVGANDKITIFDFDDCNYQWYEYDLAVPFFLLRYWLKGKGLEKEWPKWKSQILDGYSSVRRFNETLLERFETYRTLVMLGWCLKNFDSNDLDANAKTWIEKTITYCESLINPQ